MSRGIGKLQRALLAELERRTEESTTAIELAMATQLGGALVEPTVNQSHLVAVRRALHGLHQRGLVCLSHESLRCYRSEIYGRLLLVQHEVLAAWLPSRRAPRNSPWSNEPETLNPKRCVSFTSAGNATLTAEPAE
jgi:hypothetical protein